MGTTTVTVPVTTATPTIPKLKAAGSTAGQTPCSPLVPVVTSPLLFCFSMMMPGDLPLMLIQLSENAGIFGCNEYAVYSNGTYRLGEGGPKCPIETIAIDIEPAMIGSRS